MLETKVAKMDKDTTQPGMLRFPRVNAWEVLFLRKKDPPNSVIPIKYTKKMTRSM